MNYNWMKYEEIRKAKYPNLLAEIKESGYSICTISDHMGFGMCKENNPVIWDKLMGKTDISADKAVALAKLFRVELKYLLSGKLYVVSGKSVAYWRWLDHNTQMEKELKIRRYLDEINRLIRERADVECAKAVYSFAIGYVGVREKSNNSELGERVH